MREMELFGSNVSNGMDCDPRPVTRLGLRYVTVSFFLPVRLVCSGLGGIGEGMYLVGFCWVERGCLGCRFGGMDGW
jgi:hypothetical protein